MASTWGIMGEPALGRAFANSARRGIFAATFAHSARANADGTRAYVSYWDAGVIVLDIADPTNPRYLGRTTFAPDEEGNAHSVAEARGGALLVAADENFTPSRLSFAVAAPESLARASTAWRCATRSPRARWSRSASRRASAAGATCTSTTSPTRPGSSR